MPYGLQNPELMLKFGLQITQSESYFETSNMTYGVQSGSHFRTSNLTYGLHNLKYILLLKCTKIHNSVPISVKEHKRTNAF